jgi:hypothetical protein
MEPTSNSRDVQHAVDDDTLPVETGRPDWVELCESIRRTKKRIRYKLAEKAKELVGFLPGFGAGASAKEGK